MLAARLGQFELAVLGGGRKRREEGGREQIPRLVGLRSVDGACAGVFDQCVQLPW